MTDTHLVTSRNTDSRRQSKKLIGDWNQPNTRLPKTQHMLPLADIYELRTSSTESRITVYTRTTVLTMRGFQRRQRRDAANRIADAAGLVRTKPSTYGPDRYTRPGVAAERFDGDANTIAAAPDRTIRSLVWALHSPVAFFMAWQWANDAAYGESAGPIGAALLGFSSAFCAVAGSRFLMMRLTFNASGIVVVNFWTRHKISWTELTGATTTYAHTRWRRQVVTFEPPRRRTSTVTTCWTKARAQRIAKQIAVQVDAKSSTRSAVYADDLMRTGRPTSESRTCLNAGALLPPGL